MGAGICYTGYTYLARIRPGRVGLFWTIPLFYQLSKENGAEDENYPLIDGRGVRRET